MMLTMLSLAVEALGAIVALFVCKNVKSLVK